MSERRNLENFITITYPYQVLNKYNKLNEPERNIVALILLL